MKRKHKNKPDTSEQPPRPEADADPTAEPSLELTDAVEIDLADLPADVAALISTLTQERDEARDARLRALADFRNFQRRATENETRALAGGKSHIVRSLLPALDQLDIALAQDCENMSTEQMVTAFRLIRDELLRAMAQHDVHAILPQVGDEFDPNMHEAMMQQPSAEVPENHITMVMQGGYQMGATVLRPAKVAVASAPVEYSIDDADVDDVQEDA
jgi:molecular chaperone GrpE